MDSCFTEVCYTKLNLPNLIATKVTSKYEHVFNL